MNLNQLRYFQAIIKNGSFISASRTLNVSEPTVSNSMKKLENELNIKLFERHGKNVIPTKEAMSYYYYVNRSLTTLDTGNKKVRVLSQVNSLITVGFVYSLGSRFIPKLVKSYWRKNPKNDMKFIQKNSIMLNRDLKNGNCDVVICSFPDKKESGMIYTPILEQEMVVVTGSNNHFASKKSISLNELGDEPLITFPNGSDIRNYINNVLLKNRISPQKIMELEEDRTILGFVAQNMGYAILPKTEVKDFRGVKEIPIIEKLPSQYIYLGVDSEKNNLKGINEFVKFIEEYCKINYLDIHKKI